MNSRAPTSSYTKRFRYREPSFGSGGLSRVMQHDNKVLGEAWKLGTSSIDDNAALELVEEAGWADKFPDGSFLDDWSDVSITVHDVRIDPMGLSGDLYSYDVTLVVPASARYS